MKVVGTPIWRWLASTLAGGFVVTATGAALGSTSSVNPVVQRALDIESAEQVAARFVGLFEQFSPASSYGTPAPSNSGWSKRQGELSSLATSQLAARLSSPQGGGFGPQLAMEQFTTVAKIDGFEVEGLQPNSLDLMVDAAITTSTLAGRSLTHKLVPVVLDRRGHGWKVADVDGLMSWRPSSLPAGVSDVEPQGDAAQGAGTDHAPASAGSTASPAIPADLAAYSADVAGSADNGSGSPQPASIAVGDIPSDYVGWMRGAVGAECPSIPWTILAGIAKVESDFGQSDLPGVSSGSNFAGAEGPMQFEPATFAAYAVVAPGGMRPASPYDPADAIYSAAHLLCANGAADPSGLYSALFDYNHSDAYVSLVEAYSASYEASYERVISNQTNSTPAHATPVASIETGAPARATSVMPSIDVDAPSGRGLASVVVADARSYLGTPYVWGGESPGGFDCSGLVQWVFAEAGISLPRVAHAQFQAGPELGAEARLLPGDLVFFGAGPGAVEHVGIYVGDGTMIDAPHTGAEVCFDRVFGFTPPYVGATRPEIPDIDDQSGVPVITPVTPLGPMDSAPDNSAPDNSGLDRPLSSAPPATTKSPTPAAKTAEPVKAVSDHRLEMSSSREPWSNERTPGEPWSSEPPSREPPSREPPSSEPSPAELSPAEPSPAELSPAEPSSTTGPGSTTATVRHGWPAPAPTMSRWGNKASNWDKASDTTTATTAIDTNTRRSNTTTSSTTTSSTTTSSTTTSSTTTTPEEEPSPPKRPDSGRDDRNDEERCPVPLGHHERGPGHLCRRGAQWESPPTQQSGPDS